MRRANVFTTILAIFLSAIVFSVMIVRSLNVLDYERSTAEIVAGEETVTAGNVYDRNGLLIAVGGQDGKMQLQGSDTAAESFSNLFGISYGYLKSPFYIRSAVAEILYGLTANKLDLKLFTQTGNKGDDVVLTLDYSLNEKVLESMKEQIGEGLAAVTVVYNYKTGEIVAAVNTPSFNLNDSSTYPLAENGLMSADAGGGKGSNKIVMEYYNPDSTFKPIIDSIAYDYDPALMQTEVDCTGEIVVDGENVITDEEHGRVNLTTALALSCNIFQESTVFQVPNEVLEEGLKRFGMNHDGTDQTSSGLFFYTGQTDFSTTFDKASGIIGEGQTCCTPLQLVRMYGALFNQGIMLTPRIVVGEEDGETVQAVSAEAAEAVKQGMIEAVQNDSGTCRNLRYDDINVAGKTGTSSTGSSAWCVAGILEDSTPYVVATGIFGVTDATGYDDCEPVVRQIIDMITNH